MNEITEKILLNEDVREEVSLEAAIFAEEEFLSWE